MLQTKKLICEKHAIEYEGRLLFGKIPLGCPKCREAEAEAQRLREVQRLKQKDTEIKQCNEFRVQASGLPKKLINTKAKFTENFKRFSKHLISLEKNLFLCGSVGTGKSMFCAELIKRNTQKFPQYYCASDLVYLTNAKKAEFLKSVEICELFIIDEISDLAQVDESFLNALIDKLYSNDCLLVLVGNVSKDFLNTLSLKVLSRLNAKGLEICEFKGKDLRLYI